MNREPLEISAQLQGRIHDLGLEFLADFLEVETRRHPRNLDALVELGHVYTRLKRFGDGLRIDEQLVRIAPQNPTVHYNLACSRALLGSIDAAFDALERAIELGYDDAEYMRRDDDLARLRDVGHFHDLVARIEARTGA
ncbi:MAG: hypothetical protein GY711_23625 [bacterium]|nr:hypothetical protein [bacterium]